MDVKLIAVNENETCTWCERTKECVTADFNDGFIKSAPLCWKCLQKAVKVRNRQETKTRSGPGRDSSTATPTK